MKENSFVDQVLSQVPSRPVPFPQVTYDPDGDCIEFLLSNESYYAQRLDGLTTIYRSQETSEIVGSLLTGVRAFLARVLQRAPGFRVEIQDGRIRLEHLFTARLWSEVGPPGGEEVYLYRLLRNKAEETGAEVEVPDLAAA
jgi:hypothetical protein